MNKYKHQHSHIPHLNELTQLFVISDNDIIQYPPGYYSGCKNMKIGELESWFIS